MNGFTNAILTLLLGWLRSIFNAVWTLMNSDQTSLLLQFFRSNWKTIALVLCVGGFVIDRVIYFIRWRPYYVWRSRRHKRHRPRYEDSYDEPYEEYNDHENRAPADDYAAYQRPPAAKPQPPESDNAYRQPTYTPQPEAPYQPETPYHPEAAYQQEASYPAEAPGAFAPPLQYPYTPPVQEDTMVVYPQEDYAYQPEQTVLYQPVTQQNSPGFAPIYRYRTNPEGSAYPQRAPYPAGPDAYPYSTAPATQAHMPVPSENFAPTMSYGAAFQAPVMETAATIEPRFDDDFSPWFGNKNDFPNFAPRIKPEQRNAPPPVPPADTNATQYLRDVQAGFAPPPSPEQLYEPPAAPVASAPVHPGLDAETFQQNIGLGTTGGYNPLDTATAEQPVFTPFSDAQRTGLPEEKPRGFSSLVRKARTFVSGEDEANPPTIRDLQSTVDMTNAFHAPVYPKKNSESEEE